MVFPHPSCSQTSQIRLLLTICLQAKKVTQLQTQPKPSMLLNGNVPVFLKAVEISFRISIQCEFFKVIVQVLLELLELLQAITAQQSIYY